MYVSHKGTITPIHTLVLTLERVECMDGYFIYLFFGIMKNLSLKEFGLYSLIKEKQPIDNDSLDSIRNGYGVEDVFSAMIALLEKNYIQTVTLKSGEIVLILKKRDDEG